MRGNAKMRAERNLKKMKKLRNTGNSERRRYAGKRQNSIGTIFGKNEKLEKKSNSDRRLYARKRQNAGGTKFEKNEKVEKNREFSKAAVCG